MIAWLNLRDGVHYRRAAFAAGLARCGFHVEHGVTTRPGPRDVLVTWNRYREGRLAAEQFESRGRPVLVAENGYLGNEFAGRRWYAISRNQHNGAGTWNDQGPERWDALGVTFGNWRGSGGEIVLLPQRGIGPSGVAMPLSWEGASRRRLRAAGIVSRTRRHPGQAVGIPLEQDLANCSAVVTWGSGAALKALAMGIPAFHDFPKWIGSGAALPTSALVSGQEPKRDDAARLAMFRRLAWAQWTTEEITDGKPFASLLA